MQFLQHIELRIKVILKESFIRSTGRLANLFICLAIIIDWYCVDMVYRPHEEIEVELILEILDQSVRRRPDPLTLETYQQLDL